MCEQSDTALGVEPADAYGMSTLLRHDLELLRESLLKGKLPRNLSWADTMELIGKLGEVQPHEGDEFVFVVGGQRAFFKRPHTHELGVEEAARLRKFLRDAAPEKAGTSAQPHRMVVVIDHHAAHIYQDVNGSVPREEKIVEPYDPFGFHHHLVHRKESDYKGERVPEEASYYEEIAKELLLADEIVLVGHGTGKSSAVDYLNDYLKKHHHETAERVKAVETADLSALTEPQIEAIAKSHMIAVI
jgi:hypothetical protein